MSHATKIRIVWIVALIGASLLYGLFFACMTATAATVEVCQDACSFHQDTIDAWCNGNVCSCYCRDGLIRKVEVRYEPSVLIVVPEHRYYEHPEPHRPYGWNHHR